MKRVLLFGGSGFLGSALFKELHPYMDVYGTYCSQTRFVNNKRYTHYDYREDSPLRVLRKVKPDVIISCLRGDADEQFVAHDMIIDFAFKQEAKLIFLSSANVFDGFFTTPVTNMTKLTLKAPMAFLKSKLKIRLCKCLLLAGQLHVYQWFLA